MGEEEWEVSTMEPKAVTFEADGIMTTLTNEEIEKLYERIHRG